MRRYIVIAAALLMTATSYAQSTSTNEAGVSKPIDTIATTASTDTVDAYSPTVDGVGKRYFANTNGVWSTQVTATKIDGTTNCTGYLQICVNGTDYHTIDSIVLTNTSPPQIKYKLQTGTKIVRARWRFPAPSSTQRTQIKTWWLKD